MPGLTPEQEQLAQSFEEQGYSRAQAEKKAREVAPTPQQKKAQQMRAARKGKR